MNIGQHISQEYNDELEDLRNQVLSMGGLVEEQFSGASQALLNGKIELAQEVSKLDYKVNSMEVTIDEECAQIIARRQPTAIDLRNLFTVIKVVTDLERIGDESEKIARFASELLTDAKSMNFYKNLKHMASIARNMLTDALDCYARLDSKKALEISSMDADIDAEFENLNRLLTTYLLEDTKNIESTLKVTWCARSIERVGDHAKNICEYVVYVVHGKDIRHIDDKEHEA